MPVFCAVLIGSSSGAYTVSRACGPCAGRKAEKTYLHHRDDFHTAALRLQTSQHRLSLQLHLLRRTHQQDQVVAHERRIQRGVHS